MSATVSPSLKFLIETTAATVAAARKKKTKSIKKMYSFAFRDYIFRSPEPPLCLAYGARGKSQSYYFAISRYCLRFAATFLHANLKNDSKTKAIAERWLIFEHNNKVVVAQKLIAITFEFQPAHRYHCNYLLEIAPLVLRLCNIIIFWLRFHAKPNQIKRCSVFLGSRIKETPFFSHVDFGSGFSLRFGLAHC